MNKNQKNLFNVMIILALQNEQLQITYSQYGRKVGTLLVCTLTEKKYINTTAVKLTWNW